ncbi:MAG: hypothetical protein MJZ96_06480 [Paludibacteraceae bacterium]|nr:hypothetical protein [Paludibacteraceae bacterium]
MSDYNLIKDDSVQTATSVFSKNLFTKQFSRAAQAQPNLTPEQIPHRETTKQPFASYAKGIKTLTEIEVRFFVSGLVEQK